ncbi:MAG: TolC family protein [Prevotellaceae bacterium]|jgi:outer membrane protein|nr:TolC family protein [Prevotellaceae bacterium]
MRIKKRFFCLIISILTVNAFAQKLWTLEECIAHAVSHNISVKQMEIAQRAAKTDLTSAKMAFLPDLNASAGQNWNFGRTQMQSGLYENQAQSNTTFSVGSSAPIFAGFRLVHAAAKAKLSLQAAALNLQKAKNDVELQVTSLFLQALFQKEILKIAQERFATTKQQTEKTKILVENGKIAYSQLLDIQSQAANDTMSVVQTASDLKLALLDLAQSLELQNIENFNIDDEINLIDAATGNEKKSLFLSAENIYNLAVNNKPEIKSQELSVKIAEKSLKIVQSAYFPTINLSAGIGTNYFYLYKNQGLNTAFAEQANANLGEYISLTLSVPLFNRLSVVNQSKQAKYNIENQRFELDKAKKQLFKEIQTAYHNAILANEKQTAAAQAVTAAKESFLYARERYANGKLSVFEFSQAQTRLSQAQTEEIQAKYEHVFRVKILEFYRKLY